VTLQRRQLLSYLPVGTGLMLATDGIATDNFIGIKFRLRAMRRSLVLNLKIVETPPVVEWMAFVLRLLDNFRGNSLFLISLVYIVVDEPFPFKEVFLAVAAVLVTVVVVLL